MAQRKQAGSHPLLRLLAGTAGVLIAALLCFTASLERWERRTHDLRFHLRGPRPTAARIVLAEIRDSTFKAWPETPMYAWGGYYAQAIRQARALGAERIGLDVIPARSGGQKADQALFRALKDEAERVVLSYAQPSGAELILPYHSLLYAFQDQTQDPESSLGFVDVPPEPDDVLRRCAVYLHGEDQFRPSFAAILALRAMGRAPMDEDALRALPGVTEQGALATLWINYVGPPGAFPRLALEDLAAGRLTPEQQRALRGAIVIIGPAFSGDNDIHRGPGLAHYYQGMEVHAHAIATMLDGRPLQRGSRGHEVLVTAAAGALVAVPVAFLPFGWGSLWVLAVAFGWWWAAQRAFAADALWPVAGPLLAAGLAWTGQTGARAVLEARRRRAVQALFGRHVSPAVVDRLLRDPAAAELGGERRSMTILFSDIRGFTTRSEAMEPEEVVGQLNEYLAQMAECVFATEGTLDKYIGDGLMAFWNSPLEQPDHALRAVTTAWAMLQALDRLNARWREAGRPALEIGIGINTGEVLVGNLGSKKRLNYTVIGHEVNLAARIEAANKDLKTSLLLGQATYDQVRDRVTVRAHTVEVKGVRKPVPVYEVLAFAGCPAAASADTASGAYEGVMR